MINSVHIKLSNKAKKQYVKLPLNIQRNFRYWVMILENYGIDAMIKMRGYNFEKLVGNLSQFYSIRLNRAYRAIFTIVYIEEKIKINVKEINKHDY